MNYFPLLYRLKDQERYLIWIGDEEDSVATETDHLIPTFATAELLKSYAHTRGYEIETEKPVLHDLDWVEAWCSEPGGIIDCRKALAAWNLFGDVADSIEAEGHNFKSADTAALTTYNKLFWGNNLPSLTPKGKRFIPDWSEEDIRNFRAVLPMGLGLFKKWTFDWKAPTPES